MTRIASMQTQPRRPQRPAIPKVTMRTRLFSGLSFYRKSLIAIVAFAFLTVAANAKALDELERLTDEGIQSACHGYVLHDVVERIASWFDKDSPLCKRVLGGEPPREVLADLRRQGVVPRGGTADFRVLPQRIDMECNNDVLCMRERRRAEANGQPMSMAAYEHVRNHCQNTSPEGVYGCIENALVDWPDVRLARAVRMLPLTAQFVTQTQTALRREPAEAAAVVAQLHSNRPLDARARSEDGRWLEVRDELSGATGYVLTSQVMRAEVRPTAAAGTGAGLPSIAGASSATGSALAPGIGSSIGSGTGSGAATSTATPQSLDIDALVRSGQVGRQHQTNEAMREAARIEEERRAEEARLEAERLRLAREQEERERQRAERLERQQREAMQAARREAQRQQNMSALLAGVQSLTQDMVAMRQQQHAQTLQAQREFERLSGLSSSSSTRTLGSGGSTGSTFNSPSSSPTPHTTATTPTPAPTTMDAAELCQRMGGRWTGSSCAIGNVASGVSSAPSTVWNAASGGARQPTAGEAIQLDSTVMGAIAAQRSRTPIRPNAFDARGRGGARDCDRYTDMQLVTMCFHASAAYLEYEKAALLGADQPQQDRLYAAHETTVENLLRLVDW